MSESEREPRTVTYDGIPRLDDALDPEHIGNVLQPLATLIAAGRCSTRIGGILMSRCAGMRTQIQRAWRTGLAASTLGGCFRAESWPLQPEKNTYDR